LIPDRPAIESAEGRYTVRESDRLALGETHRQVLIAVEGSVPV
jgi:hypothetical protein